MQIIPIEDAYSQTVQVTLGSQNCSINLYQKSTGFYCDLYVNNTLIIGGVICQNVNRIVRSLYLGFIGDLIFIDTQPDPVNGPSDPSSPGLGTRYQFCYLTPTDLNGNG